MKHSALLLALLPLCAHGAGFDDSDTIVFHVASHHFDSDVKLNESNPGIAIRHGVGNFFIHAGGYKNSLSRSSLYAGAGATLFEVGPLSFGFIAGWVTGYVKNAIPIVLPELSFHVSRYSAILNYVPSIEIDNARNPAVLSGSFGISF